MITLKELEMRKTLNKTRGMRGFTLLEMMVVIMIIGILSTSLVVMVPEFIDRAQMTASEKNMRDIYAAMLMYQEDHNGSWPRDDGQRFFLRLWKDRYLDRTEKNAQKFFSPRDSFNNYIPEGVSVEEYLDDWDNIGPGSTSYAGFNTGGDRLLRRKLVKNPGNTVILSDAYLVHRNAVVYMTADGATHRLLMADLAERVGMELDELLEMGIEPGPGCIAEELRMVTND